jgi:Zn-dependent protease with chaperone function
MASFLETIVEALQGYWSSPLPLSVIAVCGASMATLLYVFVMNGRNPKLRVSLLTGLYALSIFFWAFVAVSLTLCVSQARMVAYARNGVPIAVTGAVLGGLAISGVVSGLVWRYGNRAILRKFPARNPRDDETWLQSFTNLLGRFEGMPPVAIRVVDSDEALALAVGGRERTILLSKALLLLLDRDEAETVVAHEMMHLKHRDAEFKVFSRVLSRILFFDPFSKFFDPAVHREREFLADEASGRSTGKPAALAAALLKIAERGKVPKTTWGLSILGSGRGIFSRYPSLGERVQRLLFLSDLINRSGKEPYGGPA